MSSMPEPRVIRQNILALMKDGAPLSDQAFDEHALACFAFQFTNNRVYRGFCERRMMTPAAARSWLDVPAVPTSAFKEAELVTGPVSAAQAVFRTSGTTQGSEKRGVHYVLDLELYRASLLPNFKNSVLPDVDNMRMASLIRQWQSGDDSSLAYMGTTVMTELGTADNLHAVGERTIDYNALDHWLRATTEPVCIIGTSLAFVHWLEYLRDSGSRYQLPAGSRIMDTGGFKGSQRAITSAGLKMLYESLLGIPTRYVINEYGMTEMLSQFYDVHLRVAGADNIKTGPPWVRTAVVDPETLAPVPRGQVGLLRHFDLANLFSICAIQTEDLGRENEHGFELLGRAPGSTPRGCSIAMDIFLSAARS
jgi:hypothetical protein